jgi:hypothetical protein
LTLWGTDIIANTEKPQTEKRKPQRHKDHKELQKKQQKEIGE